VVWRAADFAGRFRRATRIELKHPRPPPRDPPPAEMTVANAAIGHAALRAFGAVWANLLTDHDTKTLILPVAGAEPGKLSR